MSVAHTRRVECKLVLAQLSEEKVSDNLEPTDVIVNVVGNVAIMKVLCMSACLVIACNHPRCLRILMCQSSSYVVYGLAMYGLAMMYPFLLQLKCFHLLAPKCLVLTSMYSVKISFTRYCFSTKLYQRMPVFRHPQFCFDIYCKKQISFYSLFPTIRVVIRSLGTGIGKVSVHMPMSRFFQLNKLVQGVSRLDYDIITIFM